MTFFLNTLLEISNSSVVLIRERGRPSEYFSNGIELQA